jgi:hypothetical protein
MIIYIYINIYMYIYSERKRTRLLVGGLSEGATEGRRGKEMLENENY